MSDLVESPVTRLMPSTALRGHLRHPCYACGACMVVPDQNAAAQTVEDGDIWACGSCGAPHEYYLVFARGQRAAMVRLLRGVHVRAGYEPTIGEHLRR